MKKLILAILVISSSLFSADKNPKECFVVIKMAKTYYPSQYKRDDGVPKEDLNTINTAISNGYQILPYFYEDEKRSVILQPMIHKSCLSTRK